MKIIYEWCYETTDKDGDIIDNDHSEKLSDFSDNRKTNQLCLIRNEGDDINGLSDRYWAYVKSGKLPEYFSDSIREVGIRVPQRFHQELKRYQHAHN